MVSLANAHQHVDISFAAHGFQLPPPPSPPPPPVTQAEMASAHDLIEAASRSRRNGQRPDDDERSPQQQLRAFAQEVKKISTPHEDRTRPRTGYAQRGLSTTTYAVPDIRNVTEVNMVYLSACVTAITVVCLEIPFVPGCHGCETYLAHIALTSPNSTKRNPQVDRVCNVIMRSGLCDFLNDIPVCPVCEALSDESSDTAESHNKHNKTAVFA
ncbi:hypothetical protein FGB62_291g016 [Gracilaria domingensis]|nr:hypothetical protein FGB62_291g016 [Gracilaria domingensis]